MDIKYPGGEKQALIYPLEVGHYLKQKDINYSQLSIDY